MKSKMLLFAVCVTIGLVFVIPHIVLADVLVYDNNDQYLGIKEDLAATHMSVFIPSIGATMNFHYWLEEICEYGNAVFESSDCSGPPYSDGPLPQIFDLSLTRGGYYKPTYSGKQTFTPGSYYDDNCVCQQNATLYPNAEYYPLIQVQMPFTTPIALPIRFEYTSDSATKAVVIPLF